jgi:hypothetical protein
LSQDHPLPVPEPTNDQVREVLLALLQCDPTVRETIRQFVAPQPDEISPTDAASALLPERELLGCIRADATLAQSWLAVDEPEDRQLVRLIATASQWDRLLLLWDHLAARCKTEQRGVSANERKILEGGLALHNLVWQERNAGLLDVQPGSTFDPLAHERGTLLGHAISEQWLPGLHNAAGQVQRKPLVRT